MPVDPTSERSCRSLRLRRLGPLALVGWALLVVTGFGAFYAYGARPGPRAATAARWPETDGLDRASVPTVVCFMHPGCACSHATLAELDRVARRLERPLRRVLVFVVESERVPRDTRLVDAARRVPDADLRFDDGALARAFGALTSGDCFAYDADGALLYRGGLTVSRGHEGWSAGGLALLGALEHGEAAPREHHVFGCALLSDARDARDAPEATE